ncbi:MAG TPA: hypothetical protein VMX79_12360 [bacterium]|nr:hypothetical protein [bacterium]
MKKFALVISLVACVAVGAQAADVIVERAEGNRSIPEATGLDNTVELKWDTGFAHWFLVWITASGIFVGNDFDVSTVKTYGGLKTMRVALWDWPNTGWEGGRIAVFSYAGGVPGSIMWPTNGTPKFVMPTGATSGFKDFDVTYVLQGTKKFTAAWEQFYNYPNADSFGTDYNPTFSGHSWMYTGGSWSLFYSENIAPYRNVMIRMIVDNEQNEAVSPSSIGRVKALYY